MSLKSLGKVTVATSGTPVQATTTRTTAQTVYITSAPANTGIIYVGNSAMSVSGGTGIYGVIAKNVSTVSGPFTPLVFSEPNAPAGINLADIWIDSDVNGTIAFVSYSEQ